MDYLKFRCKNEWLKINESKKNEQEKLNRKLNNLKRLEQESENLKEFGENECRQLIFSPLRKISNILKNEYYWLYWQL